MILHRKIDNNFVSEFFFSFVDLDTGSIYSVERVGLYVDKSVGCFFFESSKVGRLRFLLRRPFDTIVFSLRICLERIANRSNNGSSFKHFN